MTDVERIRGFTSFEAERSGSTQTPQLVISERSISVVEELNRVVVLTIPGQRYGKYLTR